MLQLPERESFPLSRFSLHVPRYTLLVTRSSFLVTRYTMSPCLVYTLLVTRSSLHASRYTFLVTRSSLHVPRCLAYTLLVTRSSLHDVSIPPFRFTKYSVIYSCNLVILKSARGVIYKITVLMRSARPNNLLCEIKKNRHNYIVFNT